MGGVGHPPIVVALVPLHEHLVFKIIIVKLFVRGSDSTIIIFKINLETSITEEARIGLTCPVSTLDLYFKS